MTAPTRGYWLISHVNLAAMLRRVADGEDPGLVLAEEFANCDHELLARLNATPVDHRVTAVDSATDKGRDTKRIWLRCSVDGCLTGTIKVSPVRAADALLALIQDHHDSVES